MKNRVRLSFALIFLLLAPQQTARAQFIPSGVEGTSKIKGKVVNGKGKKLQGVRLLAYHLSSEELYTSELTRSNGQF